MFQRGKIGPRMVNCSIGQSFPFALTVFGKGFCAMIAKRIALESLRRPTLLRFLFLKCFIYSTLPIAFYFKKFGFGASFFIYFLCHKFLVWPRAPPPFQVQNRPSGRFLPKDRLRAFFSCGNDETANVLALEASGRLPLWVRVPVPALISGKTE